MNCIACLHWISNKGYLPQGNPRVKFCRQCGAPLEMRIPVGEREWRPVCTACSAVDYSNPKLVRLMASCYPLGALYAASGGAQRRLAGFPVHICFFSLKVTTR